MRLGVIIPAAGKGSRMKRRQKKQFIDLDNKPVLQHTLAVFANWRREIAQLNVMVAGEDIDFCRQEIVSSLDWSTTEEVEVLQGGQSRRETVKKGLAALAADIDSVIVHDGARPFLSFELLNRVLSSLSHYPAVTAAIPIKDTIKKINEKGLVEETLDRKMLRAVQTPQAFRCEVLRRAHHRISPEVKATDDASLVEMLGEEVLVVQGEEENFKLTTPRDLFQARSYLQNKK